VQTKLGEGTEFIIDLPAPEETPEPQVSLTTSIQKGTGRILAMDDEPALQFLMQNVLTKLGYEVQIAADGAEAIFLFENAKGCGRGFDAVLLDLTISGGMGGIETAAKLKLLDASVKLIVCSGYSEAPVASELCKYGFDDIIPKPWTIASLSEVFRRVLVHQV
jgi:two-component system cell cycle sensor histidine kinase/response regulator CckA